jgi:hypothetical protein
MILRTVVTSILIGTLLAACSGGSSSSSASSGTLPQAGTQASGTIKISIPASSASSSARKRPQYISNGANAAYYSVDTNAAQAMTCVGSNPISCTASFTVSAGSHNFNAEVYDTTNNKILAEGQAASQSVSAGNGNSVTITLAGVATNVVFPMGTCAGSTCGGTAGNSSGVAVTDFDSDNITSIPTYFDDGTLTITGVTESAYNGSCGSCDDDTITISGGDSLSTVNNSGYYTWAATCNDDDSQFYVTSITAQYPNGPNSGDPWISTGGAAYPSLLGGLSVTYYTYLCDGSEHISVGAMGTIHTQ